MQCPKCGTELASGALCCPECGEAVPDEVVGNNSPTDLTYNGATYADSADYGTSDHAYAAAQPPVENATQSGAPLVLGIVGLVLGITLVFSPIGLALCIVGLAIGAKSKSTGPKALNIVGIVISSLAMVFMVAITAFSVYLVSNSDVLSTGSTYTAPAEGYPAESMTSIASPTDAACLDQYGNVTAYALANLTGKDLVTLLESNGYTYDADLEGWQKGDGKFGLYVISDTYTFLTKSQVEQLPLAYAKGSVDYCAWGTGYADMTGALEGLGNIVFKTTPTEDADNAFAFAEDGLGNQISFSLFYDDGETSLVI